MSRMTSDIENLQQLLQDGLSQLAIQGLTMVVITVILFTTNVRLALITIVLIIPALIGASVWFKRASERGYDRVRDGIANVLADLSESLHGVRIVTAHNRQRHNVIHHRNVVGDYRDANNYTAQINAIYGPAPSCSASSVRPSCLAIGGEMVSTTRCPSAPWWPSSSTSTGSSSRSSCWSSSTTPTSRVRPRSSSCAACSTPSRRARGARRRRAAAHRGRDRVRPRLVRLRPGQPVIDDVNLTIAPGETVAFVGPTGAGKSTMAKLVTRFYDPTGGRVLIDGYDLRDVTMLSLRRQLGVVPQEPFLFAGTIRDNIAFARPGRHRRRGLGGRGPGRASSRSSSACPRGSTPSSTSGASRCPRASDSSSPWPAPSWPIRGCWCSTRPPPTSTSSPKRRSKRPSTSCSRTAPPSSSPTGCRRP